MVVCGPFEGSEGTANDFGRLRIRLGELLNYFLDWSVRNDQRDDLTAKTGKPILKKGNKRTKCKNTKTDVPTNIIVLLVVLSRKFVPLISCTITFDQNFIFT